MHDLAQLQMSVILIIKRLLLWIADSYIAVEL